MSLLVKVLPHHLPVFARKAILSALFKATADAFECPAPPLDHSSYETCLRAYALFTREQAEKALRTEPDLPALKTRLYHNAYPLGRRLRKWSGVNTLEAVMVLGQILYRAIGVEIVTDCATSEGENASANAEVNAAAFAEVNAAAVTRADVTVNRCYFSQFYSSPVCDLISALDDGIFSGLSGGGRLVFSQRITEQHVPAACCRAKLQFKEQRK